MSLKIKIGSWQAEKKAANVYTSWLNMLSLLQKQEGEESTKLHQFVISAEFFSPYVAKNSV